MLIACIQWLHVDIPAVIAASVDTWEKGVVDLDTSEDEKAELSMLGY